MRKIKRNPFFKYFLLLAPSPDRFLPIDKWAEKYINLPAITCSEPGPMRLDRTPYIKGPLKAFQSIPVQHIVLIWGRQVGKSQGFMYTCLAHCLAEDPGPTLIVLPSGALASYTSLNRIQPLLLDCEPVKAKLTGNPDDFTTLEMRFIDSVVTLVGGESTSQLMSRPVRYLFRDEIDVLKAVGNESDPLKTSEATTTSFMDRKIIDTSTPTDEEGNVWQQLLGCDMVFQFYVPCPHCGEIQPLIWPQVKFTKEKKCRDAHYECLFCSGSISEIQKREIVKRGEWHESSFDAVLTGEYAAPGRSLDEALSDGIERPGFHLPQWYGLFYNTTFYEAARQFIKAHEHYKNTDDVTQIRDWTRFFAARPYSEKIQSASEHDLMRNKIDLPSLTCPSGTRAVTCGVDVGQGGFWFVVLAWSQAMAPHLVHYGFIPGMLGSDDEALRMSLFESWFAVQGSNSLLPIWRTGMDSGGSKYGSEELTMTEAAYMWIRQHGNRRVFAMKGASTARKGHKLWLTQIDKTPSGKRMPGGLQLINLDTGAIKDAIHYRLGLEEGRAGRFTFNAETQPDYISHLMAEERRRSKKGIEWVRVRRANHLLDATVMAFACADPEFLGGVLKAPDMTKRRESLSKNTRERSAGLTINDILGG